MPSCNFVLPRFLIPGNKVMVLLTISERHRADLSRGDKGWNPELVLLSVVLLNSTNLAVVIPNCSVLVIFMLYNPRFLLQIRLNYVFCALFR